jgi:hypothetical protein
MAYTLSDLRPEAARVQTELLRRAPSWRKMDMVGQMYQTVRVLALVGLRARYPKAPPEELRRRHADTLLGPELAARAYGDLPSKEPTDVA